MTAKNINWNEGVITTITSLLRTEYFWLSLFLYFGTLLTWLSVLKLVPLSKAYPILGLVFVSVPLISNIMLGEYVSVRTYISSAIIALGVSLAL